MPEETTSGVAGPRQVIPVTGGNPGDGTDRVIAPGARHLDGEQPDVDRVIAVGAGHLADTTPPVDGVIATGAGHLEGEEPE